MLFMQMLNINAIDLFDDFDCKICNLFKLTKKVNRETPKWAFWRLEKMHIDVWDSYRIFNFENNRYFVFLIDDLIKKSWINLIKSRTQILEKIHE